MSKQFFGNYRGEVMSDADAHGRVRIFVRGVYPEELRNNIIDLPSAEPAMPLNNGGNRLSTLNRDLNIGDEIPDPPEKEEVEDITINPDEIDPMGEFDLRTNIGVELSTLLNKDPTQQVESEELTALIDGASSTLTKATTFAKNMVDKLKSQITQNPVLSGGDLGSLKKQKAYLEKRLKLFEEKLAHYPSHETANIEATKQIIEEIKQQLIEIESKIADAEQTSDDEIDELADTFNSGAVFTGSTGHSAGAIKGQFVWVFFEGGDHNHPIYFASCPAGEAWGVNSPGIVANNSKGIANVIDESLFIETNDDNVDAVEKILTDNVDREEFTTFYISNKNKFTELSAQSITEFIIEKSRIGDEEQKTLNSASKPELIKALNNYYTTILDETEDEKAPIKQFDLSETTTHGLFGFTSAEEMSTAFKQLMLFSMLLPTITEPLCNTLSTLFEQIVGTSIKITHDETGKPTYNIILGGNLRLLINGDVNVLQNGNLSHISTGSNTVFSMSNTITPFPVSLMNLMSLGVVAIPMIPGAEGEGEGSESDSSESSESSE